MVREIHPIELKERLGGERPPILIDVREDFEVAIASFPNAIHIPLRQLEDRADEIEQGAVLVVLCHHGVRSINGAFLLERMGWVDVASLAGGIDAWSLYVDPEVPRY